MDAMEARTEPASPDLDDLERFMAEENIRRFHKLLDMSTGETQRRAIKQQLADQVTRLHQMIDDDRIPITPREAYSGDYWRQRAKLAREKASKFAGEMMRNFYTEMAADYERLADRADNVQREYRTEQYLRTS